MANTLRVVFVCSGNICRSPMAEVIGKERFDEAGRQAICISAGTLGIVGEPAATHAQRAVTDLGLDLEQHRSQSAASGLLQHADFVVAMAPRHIRELKRMDPNLAPKLVSLWDYLPSEHPAHPLRAIADPVGRDYETFVVIRDQIDACLRAWIATLE